MTYKYRHQHFLQSSQPWEQVALQRSTQITQASAITGESANGKGGGSQTYKAGGWRGPEAVSKADCGAFEVQGDVGSNVHIKQGAQPRVLQLHV